MPADMAWGGDPLRNLEFHFSSILFQPFGFLLPVTRARLVSFFGCSTSGLSPNKFCKSQGIYSNVILLKNLFVVSIITLNVC